MARDEATTGSDVDVGVLFADMVGFRNVLVHGYDEVDLAIVRDVLEHRLEDLLAFVAVIRRRMADQPST